MNNFVFDGDWKKFHKVVQFTQCDETYNLVLGTDGNSCLLPAELHEGAVKMSVFGYDAENTSGLRATTVHITLYIHPSGFVGDGSTPILSTPDLYQQLLDKMSQGVDGKSAYEIAQKNGCKDSEEEWLKSLHGKDGITPDMSEYPKINEVESLISESVSTISEQVHTHENKSTLDQITDEILTDIAGISEFKETIKSELQDVKDAIEPIATQAHWHHNLNLLNGIISNKIAEWDSIATLKQQFLNLNNLYTELQNIVNTNSGRIDTNDREIASIQSVLTDLQQQIDALKFN